eukprot:2826034-Karenia_brevis.AAC.1
MEILSDATGYHDREAINMFRYGARIVGELPISGNGTCVDSHYKMDVQNMLENRFNTSQKMLERMGKVDRNMAQLLE